MSFLIQGVFLAAVLKPGVPPRTRMRLALAHAAEGERLAGDVSGAVRFLERAFVDNQKAKKQIG